MIERKSNIQSNENTENEIIRLLNETVWVRLGVSHVHGVGVVAIRDIPKGTEINLCAYCGDVFTLSGKSFDKLDSSIQKLLLDRSPFYGDTIHFLHPNNNSRLELFFNHSFDSNVLHEKYITTKDIKEGEELFTDYTSIKMGDKNKKHFANFLPYKENG